MTEFYWVAGVFGFISLLVCCSGLGVAASMLWSLERRGATFLWVAFALFLFRGLASPLMNFVVFRIVDTDKGLLVTWGMDAVLSISAWLAMTAALVMIARTMRERGILARPPSREITTR